jgi:hypothetical protein
MNHAAAIKLIMKSARWNEQGKTRLIIENVTWHDSTAQKFTTFEGHYRLYLDTNEELHRLHSISLVGLVESRIRNKLFTYFGQRIIDFKMYEIEEKR